MTTAFDPPKSDDSSADDFDPSAVKPSWMVILASVLVGFAGAMTATAGFQIAAFIRFYSDIANVIPWIILTNGLILVVLAAFLSRGRSWAAWAAAIVVTLTTLIALGWNVYLILAPVLSPANWLMLIVDAIAAITVPFVIPETKRITQLRNKLYSEI